MTSEIMASILRARHPRSMLESLTKAALLVVAVIHLMPAVGFVGRSTLAKLYDISIDSPDLEVLMRHRSTLFGILGSIFAYAAFHAPTRPVAFAAAAASLVTFFYLSATVAGTTRAIRKIIIADILATAALAGALRRLAKHCESTGRALSRFDV